MGNKKQHRNEEGRHRERLQEGIIVSVLLHFKKSIQNPNQGNKTHPVEKANPIGLRVGINRTWDSRWFSAKDYAAKLIEDLKLRKFVTEKLKAAGIPTIHFISPSIWAWRGGRIKGIKESVDHMLCIFPFESQIYDRAGIQSTYVGHPLASTIPMVPDTDGAKRKLNAKAGSAVVAVLPGSRKSEIAMIAPGFFEAIGKMFEQYQQGIEFVVPIATDGLRPAINELTEQIRQRYPNIVIHLLDGQASLALEAADVVLIASGTATLEAALWKKPMVISYKVPALTAWIMKRQAYLPYVGLPNILAGEFVVPELLQDAATPDALAQSTLAWLDQPVKVANLKERFTKMHETLSLPTGKLVANVIADVIHAK